MGASDDSRLDLAGLPPKIADAYNVFAAHCSRCHTLGRPINAPVRDVEHWDRYVGRMMKVPGAGINHREAKGILVFLHYYTEHIKYPKQEQAAPAPQPSAPHTQSMHDAHAPAEAHPPHDAHPSEPHGPAAHDADSHGSDQHGADHHGADHHGASHHSADHHSADHHSVGIIPHAGAHGNGRNHHRASFQGALTRSVRAGASERT